jgi:hypothetical protein
VAAPLDLAEDALALHLLLQHSQRLIDVVVSDHDLHSAPRFLEVETSGQGDVPDRGLSVLTIDFGVVGDFLAFCQAADPRPFEGRHMDKDVRTAAVRLDKAETLLAVEI